MLLGFVNIYADVNEYFRALTGAVVLWANMQQESSSLHQLVYYFYFIYFIFFYVNTEYCYFIEWCLSKVSHKQIRQKV